MVAKTRLEREKEAKKKLAERDEVLDVIGQENDKLAAKAVIEVEQEKEKKQRDKRHFVLNKLDDLVGNPPKYKEYLRDIALVNMQRVEFPIEYGYRVSANERGLLFEFRDVLRRRYAQGMNVLLDPEWDLYGVNTMVERIINTVDHLEGRDVDGSGEGNLGKAGVVLPR